MSDTCQPLGRLTTSQTITELLERVLAARIAQRGDV